MKERLFKYCGHFFITIALLLTPLCWWLVFADDSDKSLDTQASPEEEVSMASLLGLVAEGTGTYARNWTDGELPLLAAPPWTKLDRADLEKLVAGAGSASGGLIPDLPPKAKKERRDKAFANNEDEISKYFPYMYTGGMRVRGEYHALIEDADTGACYFRKLGEKLGKFSVIEVSKTAVTLVHDKNGKQVRLLKTPLKAKKRVSEGSNVVAVDSEGMDEE